MSELSDSDREVASVRYTGLNDTLEIVDDGIGQYMAIISRYPLLEAEEEVSLARIVEIDLDPESDSFKDDLMIQNAARDRFINSNLRLVVHIAKKYVTEANNLLDLVQHGNEGLMTAVEKYDWRKGFRFSTYATWWIQQAIHRGVGNDSAHFPFRVPVHGHEELRTLKKEVVLIDGFSPVEVDLEGAANAVGLDAMKAERAIYLGLMENPDSLNKQLSQDASSVTESGDLIADASVDVEGETLDFIQFEEDYGRIIGILNNRAVISEQEHRVVEMRFGLIDGNAATQDVVSDELDITREDVRVTEKRAIAKIKIHLTKYPREFGKIEVTEEDHAYANRVRKSKRPKSKAS